ncbi:MAG TPA: Xaa-Pro peptidase family protein [Terriglobales bacterium]|nr:Xaa-Pro peptidase family protein [Terriglobales bacterium]
MNHRVRLQGLQKRIAEHRLHGLIVSHLPNIRYLCGFTGSAGILLVSGRDKLLFTDGRYTEQARAETKGAKVKIVKNSPLIAAGEWLAKRKHLRRMGIEAAHLTVADRAILSKAVGRHPTLISTPALVERLRMIKDSAEIASIRAACRLGVELFSTVTENLRAGVPESQVAGELEFAARKNGVDQMSFPTIIAGGERSALPHGRASSAAIPANGFVVCDFGVILAGYCSDMTRTVHMGSPGPEARDTYNAVLEAQQAAVETVRPGATVGEVDQAARKLLYNRKLGKFFTHSTGHGVGLEIHEAPRIAAAQKEVLQPGMVLTIEPGVYHPGKWGVRIEDTVVVTQTGCEILTACSKDLLTI